MSQTFSAQRTYRPPLMLTIPRELVGIFELTLAKTCKALYDRYEQYYENRTAVVLYDPQHEFSCYDENTKEFRLCHGWLHLKFALILDSQISNCPIKILCLNGKLKAPENLDCVCVNSFIIRHFFVELIPTISLIGKFLNLKSPNLERVIFG
jgi:hypothetical protein